MSEPTELISINLGSGQRKFKPPFINVDVQPIWNPDIVASGESMPMFADACAKVIVLHHVLEHFGCGEADKMLKECWRILAPGGSLIVTVPDVCLLFRAHHRGELSTQLLMTNLYGAYMGDEADRHKWAYTGESLVESLQVCAVWDHIKTFDHRKIPGADIAKDWWILGIEAVK